jgi:hypothetical protein
MIETYRILIAENIRELGQIVRSQINEGWIPQGAPFVARNQYDWSDRWYQAMIKYKSNDVITSIPVGDVPQMEKVG